MIRIINEAKEDFDNLLRIIYRAKMDAFGYKLDDESIERGSRGYDYDKIDKFKEFRSQLTPPENDVTYWCKQIKENGIKGVREFEQLVDTFEKEKQAKKDFTKTFPSSLVRRFNQNKDKFPLYQQYYRYWMEEVEWSNPREITEKLRLTLKRLVGYSDEEKKQIEEGAELLYDDNGWKIYAINNHLAAEYYGQGTGWCISGNYPGNENKGYKHFQDYLGRMDIPSYFFALSDSGKKYCFYVEDGLTIVWNGTNGADDEVESLPGDFPEGFSEWFTQTYDIYLPLSKNRGQDVVYSEAITEFLKSHKYEDLFKGRCLSLEDIVEEYKIQEGRTNKEMIAADFENSLAFFPMRYGRVFYSVLKDYVIAHSLVLDDKFKGFEDLRPSQMRAMLVPEYKKEIISQLYAENDSYYDYLIDVEARRGAASIANILEHFATFAELETKRMVELIIESGQGKAVYEYITNLE